MSKILVVDIDETLLRSMFPVPEPINFEFEGQYSYTSPRPGAHQFLQAAKAESWIVISVTQGIVPFQEAALTACDLLKYFDGIYGWSDSSKTQVLLPALSDHAWVIVDNRPFNHPFMSQKQGWMNAVFNPETNFVRCEDWLGQEVPCLTTLLPRIKQLMDAQS